MILILLLLILWLITIAIAFVGGILFDVWNSTKAEEEGMTSGREKDEDGNFIWKA